MKDEKIKERLYPQYLPALKPKIFIAVIYNLQSPKVDTAALAKLVGINTYYICNSFCRFKALCALISGGVLSRWVTYFPSTTSVEISDLVWRVAATEKMTKTGAFKPKKFLRRLEKLAAEEYLRSRDVGRGNWLDISRFL